jgi:sugar lactone lactonase YvrE
MWNIRGERMRETMKIYLMVLTILLTLSLQTFGAEPVRMKYGLSVYSDEKGIGLKQPEGVACSDDRLVVADTGNDRLVIYSLAGGEPKGGKEVKIPQVLYPVRVATSSKGELFVLDGRQRKIARLTRDGAFVQFVDLGGVPGDGTGMVVPVGIGLDGGDNLYLLDILGGRVLVLNADGKFQRQIAFPKEYGFITDLAVDPRGTIFLVDGVKAVMYSTAKDPAVFTPITGTLKDELKFASNIVTDSKGTIYITDQNSGGVVVVGGDGAFRNRLLSLGWKEGSVRYPAQICIDSQGDLFVADRANSRIQEFTPLK